MPSRAARTRFSAEPLRLGDTDARTMSQIVIVQVTSSATRARRPPPATDHSSLAPRVSGRPAAMARAGVCRATRAHVPPPPGRAERAGSPDSHDDAAAGGAYARRMLVPLAAIWVPTAVGIAFAGGLFGILVVWVKSDPGPDADDSDSDSGGGGAGWRGRGPRPPTGGGGGLAGGGGAPPARRQAVRSRGTTSSASSPPTSSAAANRFRPSGGAGRRSAGAALTPPEMSATPQCRCSANSG